MTRNNIEVPILLPPLPAGAPLTLDLRIDVDSRFPCRNLATVPGQSGPSEQARVN